LDTGSDTVYMAKELADEVGLSRIRERERERGFMKESMHGAS